MKKPEKLEVSQGDIYVLELMIKHYEERGGGYSQKEALKLAIKALRALSEYEKWLKFLLTELSAIEAILSDIRGRHLSQSFHNNRVKADAEAGLDIATAIAKRLGRD